MMLALVGLGVLVALLCALREQGGALFTRNGSPVDVDQHVDERRAALRSYQVHQLVSPHARRGRR
jgi:hypothetical protein